MIRNKFDIDDLRALLCLTRSGSFRAAADELGLSSSALSRQIGALETRLATRLFDRDTRNLVPTASGLAMLSVAERVMNMVEDGMAEFAAHQASRRGRLTIAGLPSVTASLLPGLLKSFSSQYPELDLRIMDLLSDNVLDVVEAGAADLGFTAGTVSARGRLSFHRLLDDEFLAIGTVDGPLREDRPYSWRELVEMPFIAMAEGTSVRELLNGACARIGAELAPRFEVAHLATAGALVAEGLGVTALPALTLPILRMDTLVTRPIPDFGARRRIGLVWRSGRTLSPAAQSFLAHVRASLKI